MVRVTGSERHVARMEALSGPEMVRQVGAALFAGGQLIQVAAQISITDGAVSGKHHVPSAPGEPPNNDTGVLANNIETVKTGPLTVQVSSNAPYAVHLEKGTSRMIERPYMGPASRKSRAEVVDLVVRAARKVAAGGKVVP